MIRRGTIVGLGKVTLGLALWSCLVFVSWRLLTESRDGGKTPLDALIGYATQQSYTFDVELPYPLEVQLGSTVHIAPNVAPDEAPAGEVIALLTDEGMPRPFERGSTRHLRVRIYDRDHQPLHSDAVVRVVRIPESARWVLRTLLTEENLPRLAEEWNRMMMSRRERIAKLLTPVMVDLVSDARTVLEEEWQPFLTRHRSEVQALAGIVEPDLRNRELIAFFENKIWPVGERRLRPHLTKIGHELWDRLPLWGLSWRLAYQTLPGTRNDYVQEALTEFVRQEAVPVVKLELEPVLKAVRQVAREVLADPEVKGRIRTLFSRLLEDEKFQALMLKFFREVVFDNPRFREKMRVRWQSPAVREVLREITGYLEPTLRRMTDMLIGTRADGITPEFARVLRSQILLKDRVRFQVDPGDPNAGPLKAGQRLSVVAMEWE